MAYIIKEVTDEELGWPFVISREELERRLVVSRLLLDDFGFDSAIRILIHGK